MITECSAETKPGTSIVLVDSHVHIHDCFQLDRFLNSALGNFKRNALAVLAKLDTAKSKTVANATPGTATVETTKFLMCLTEIAPTHYFAQFIKDAGKTSPVPGWTFHSTAEPESVYAQHLSGEGIFLIAGRQVVTTERLEVLALGTPEQISDDLSLDQTLQQIEQVGAIPVLPWAVGKWVGPRGKRIAAVMGSKVSSRVFLGDNSGRPGFWPYSPYFKLAEAQGRPVLPGTDPLSIDSEADRPGSFGFWIVGEFDQQQPGKSLKQWLLNSQATIHPYGSLENPWRFVQNQVSLRAQKPKQSQTSAASLQQKNMQPDLTHPLESSHQFPETADIETSSDDYASRFSGETGLWLLKVQEQATLKLLKPYPKATVLDVGGGHGQTLEPLLQQGYQVTILGSDESCKTRIQSFVDANLCTFQVGNVLALPYADNAFDVVISYRFLAHVTQWQQFVSELARVAKKAVIVDYPTVRSVNSIAPYLFKFKKGLEGNTRTYISYQEPELVEFFKSLGLKQTERCPQFFVPMVLHRALKSPKASSVLEIPFHLVGLTHFLGSPVIAKFTK
ncbi:MAG: class I SAM-dependent methyltransferase [Microcoleaceae cyanobacterium]